MFPNLTKQMDAFPRKCYKGKTAIISLFPSPEFMVFYSQVVTIFRAHDELLINHNSLEERRISLPFGTNRCDRSPALLHFYRSAAGNSLLEFLTVAEKELLSFTIGTSLSAFTKKSYGNS